MKLKKEKSLDVSRNYIRDLFSQDNRLVKILSKGWSWVVDDSLKDRPKEKKQKMTKIVISGFAEKYEESIKEKSEEQVKEPVKEDSEAAKVVEIVKYNKSQPSVLLAQLKAHNKIVLIGIENSPDRESLLQIPSTKMCVVCQEKFQDEVFVHRLACCQVELHPQCNVFQAGKKKFLHSKGFDCPVKCGGDPCGWETSAAKFSGKISAYFYYQRYNSYVSFHKLDSKQPNSVSWTCEDNKKLFLIIRNKEIVYREFVVSPEHGFRILEMMVQHHDWQNSKTDSKPNYCLIDCEYPFYVQDGSDYGSRYSLDTFNIKRYADDGLTKKATGFIKI